MAEEWEARCKDIREQFISIWAPWQKYAADPVPSSLEVALLELAESSLKVPINGVVHA